MNINHWAKEEDDLLIKEYPHKTVRELVNVITTRSFGAIRQRTKVLKLHKFVPNTVDEKFFETPNLINSAIGGFVSADGYIKDEHCLCIHISIKDLEYLKAISQYLKYSGKIRFNMAKGRDINKNGKICKDSYYCCLTTPKSLKLVSDLKLNFSITPRKTLTLQPPKLIELDHILAFMSGSIDGDGWITWSHAKGLKYNRRLMINFLGTEALLSWVKLHIDKLFPTDTNPQVRQDGKIYQYSITGAKAYIFSKMLLVLPIIRLDRKWNKAREFIADIENFEQSVETKTKLKRMVSPQIISFLVKYNEKIPEKLIHNPPQTV